MMRPPGPCRFRLGRRSAAASAALAAMAVLSACAEEYRVVGGGGGFKALPGAQGGQWKPGERQAIGTTVEELLARQEAGHRNQPAAERPDGGSAPEPKPVPGDPLRLQNPDGSITLICRAPSHVLHHLMTTLNANERDLLFDQVLSTRTKEEYALAGRDPREAVDDLFRHAGEIADLYATMPMGERTPGVYQEVIGRNTFRLRSAQAGAIRLRLTMFEVILERGGFRLYAVR